MHLRRLGLALSLALALALPLCRADEILTFLDTSDTLHYSISGSLAGGTFTEDCPTSLVPENCTTGLQFPPSVIPVFNPLLFNIYEPDGVTLSDTLQVFPATGAIEAAFQSDVDGVPLLALVGGQRIIEDGTVQTAATIGFTGVLTGQSFIVQFQSDVEAAPEPRLYAVVLTLGMLVLATRRRARGIE